MNIRIDKQKAVKKWAPVLENMGIFNEERIDWMSEYAEYHAINEDAYANNTIAGLGNVFGTSPSTLVGTTIGTNYSGNGGTLGSGDLGQNLLPVAMKIAGQTIGLDLVAVKPTPGPKIDLIYIDFQYDDLNMNDFNAKPQVFKVTDANNLTAISATISSFLNANYFVQVQGGLSLGQRVFFYFGPIASYTASYVGSTGAGNLAYGLGANTGNTVNTTSVSLGGGTVPLTNGEPTNKANWLEFLGFSRIDGQPILKAWRQANAVGGSTNYYSSLDATLNSFSETNTGASASMVAQLGRIFGIATSTPVISLVSALEDHIPAFSTNFQGNGGQYPMTRQQEENTYSGIIGPKVSTKSVTVGTVEVSSALRRTEIEDIKSNTGMDIVQKMESILVNELSQTISKEIVDKIFYMGDLNRASVPTFPGTSTITFRSPSGAAGTAQTIFDLDTAYAVSNSTNSLGGPGGETTHAIQRKLITKIVHASNFLATEGRIGPAQFAVTNGGLAAAFMDVQGYTINPVKAKLNTNGQMYPVGQIGDITVYVDPYMKYTDNRIVLGRKNNPDQPGVVFVPYLMAQSISLLSESTFAPRLLLRSRYAVAEVGWYPQKQYITIAVQDTNMFLN